MANRGFHTVVSIANPESDDTFICNFSTRGVTSLNEESGITINETRAVFQCIDSTLIRSIQEDYVLEANDKYWRVTDNTIHNTDPNLRNIFATKAPRP